MRDGSAGMIWLKNLHFWEKLNCTEFWNSEKKIYYVKDNNGVVTTGGTYRESDVCKVTLLTVPKAGHFVPYGNYQASYQFLKDYIDHGKLQCHLDDPNGCRTAPIMCKWMNNCSGNGQCQDNGQCNCKIGYKSADCSEKVEVLDAQYRKTIVSTGNNWVYFQYLGDGESIDFELTLSSSFPLDIYISSGWQSDPNDFSNDIAIKK